LRRCDLRARHGLVFRIRLAVGIGVKPIGAGCRPKTRWLPAKNEVAAGQELSARHSSPLKNSHSNKTASWEVEITPNRIAGDLDGSKELFT
jgi:hypothetical protein